jgi:hypothetical protein
MATNTLIRKEVRVVLLLSDASTLMGTVIIDRTMRFSDVLNKTSKDFIVVKDSENRMHIVNKHHIIQVTEVEEVEEL